MMRTVLCLLLLALTGAASPSCATRVEATKCELLDPATAATERISLALNDWHDAAAKADFDRYFAHFTPDGVFMGTDATERWSVDQFKAYAKPHFDKGKAWSFTPHDRHVVISASGATAWFDEELTTPHLGPCRGSGVMTKSGDDWKIAHYNLTIPIPNDLAKDVVKQIAAYQATSPATPAAPGATPSTNASRPASPEADALHVMTFNIRYNNPGDGADAWPNRRAMVGDFLDQQRPDVVGLQEALEGQINDLLAARPEFASVGVGRDDGQHKGEHSAILYRKDRFDVIDSGTFWFSDSPHTSGSKSWGNQITRICTWARFSDRQSTRADGTPNVFYVFNLHLDHQSQPSREQSVKLLVDRVQHRPHPDPVVITGDFNAGEQNAAVLYMKGPEPSGEVPPHAIFVDTFRVLHPDEKNVGTFNSFKGETTGDKIDYIFVSATTRVLDAVIHRDNLNGRYLSDHFPVSARINFAN